MALLLLILFSLPAVAAPPARIVSISPSTTEILFALGLGDKVVGVSRFCEYPPEALGLPKTGGLTDPNYEVIVSLQPDLAVMLDSQAETAKQLEQLGIESLTIPHGTRADIHAAIRLLGEACGATARATAMVARIESRVAALRVPPPENPPKVLVCIGRDLSAGKLSGVYIAGRNDYFDELIELAGGINAYRDEAVAYPQLGAEGIIQLAPDIIIDLMEALPEGGPGRDELLAHWDALRVVPAVKRGRVHLVTGGHALRPGPSYPDLLEALVEVIQPDAGDA